MEPHFPPNRAPRCLSSCLIAILLAGEIILWPNSSYAHGGDILPYIGIGFLVPLWAYLSLKISDSRLPPEKKRGLNLQTLVLTFIIFPLAWFSMFPLLFFAYLQIRLFGYGNWNFLALSLVAIPVSIRLLQNGNGRFAAILLGVPLLCIPGCAGCGL